MKFNDDRSISKEKRNVRKNKLEIMFMEYENGITIVEHILKDIEKDNISKIDITYKKPK